ncbi:hypothetical protein TWF718_003437 [Orbilia javanica]|uniref:F-box domain-containing protein n=1 Tax=Orbilia javanica TaxID=47235 RepID=A0AAN8MP97_9PEZI
MTMQAHPSNPLLIPELLELVLSALPALEVLTTCRTICKLWRDLIDTSPTIKYTTWRSEFPPGRTTGPKVTETTYQRNPLVLELLSNFWARLNTIQQPVPLDASGSVIKIPKRKPMKPSRHPNPIDTTAFLSRYISICHAQIFSNSPPLDVNIRVTFQEAASKHIIARSYRSVSTDVGIGWITDLSVLVNLMEEIIQLRDAGRYVPGLKNSLQAEMTWCVFLYRDGGGEGGKRRECEVVQKVDFACWEPWGVAILEGRVREVVR